jgi:hypothetical protein
MVNGHHEDEVEYGRYIALIFTRRIKITSIAQTECSGKEITVRTRNEVLSRRRDHIFLTQRNFDNIFYGQVESNGPAPVKGSEIRS